MGSMIAKMADVLDADVFRSDAIAMQDFDQYTHDRECMIHGVRYLEDDVTRRNARLFVAYYDIVTNAE